MIQGCQQPGKVREIRTFSRSLKSQLILQNGQRNFKGPESQNKVRECHYFGFGCCPFKVIEKKLFFLARVARSMLLKSTYAKMHDPHTNCLKCFPRCYYTITRQAIPMARSYQYQWLCKISSKYSLEFALPIMPFRPWDVSA